MKRIIFLSGILFCSQTFAGDMHQCSIENKKLCKDAISLVERIEVFLNQPDMEEPTINIDNASINVLYDVNYQPNELPRQDIYNFANKLEEDFCSIKHINDFIYDGGNFKYSLVGPDGTGVGISLTCNQKDS